MTSNTTIESVSDREQEVLSLLNEAYDNWGDATHFRWKYDEYSGYDPEKHTFAVIKDGEEVVAFRRMFEKELRTGDGTVTTFVLGDTAVAPDHRGQGHYSDLHAKTTTYGKSSGAAATITYNNVGRVTFKANRQRGWEYSVLPLRLYIHSYETVLSHYADLAVSKDSLFASVAKRFGDRFVLRADEERVSIVKIFGGDESGDQLQIEAAASRQAVARLVEVASNDSVSRAVPTGIKLLASGDISLIGDPDPAPTRSREPDSEVMVVDPESLSRDDIETMVDLCKFTSAGRPTFRRERRDVEHMLAYPDAEVLVVKEGAELTGFAVIGPYDNDGVVEARVLDQAAPSDAVADQLRRKLERYTGNEGYDLLVMISDRAPNPEWASIDQQVLMWTEADGLESGKQTFKNLQVSFYDVL
ncbi:GNAT family N-acetyltransferase [Halobacteria archaeon AArc-curdl1]|uniref:GNAT family N-acetyltransferase n=1 Tax=Natronosalvus hydrolyticus TaxID=2979988 RepID=A0AAP2ZAN3_9EURY|nr:GNAT family N-acetyltransferase [Halobacteria archaeon AArc-curdl1]